MAGGDVGGAAIGTAEGNGSGFDWHGDLGEDFTVRRNEVDVRLCSGPEISLPIEFDAVDSSFGEFDEGLSFAECSVFQYRPAIDVCGG